MALYREGKAAMAADGTVTGTGTKWQSSLSLIRPGATIMFLSSPIQMAVVNKVVSDTEIKAITTNGAVVASTDYAILLSDSLTVDGLAQDVAETLRYYQSQETVIADAVEFFKNFDFDSLQNLANQIKADSEAAGASATAAAASETAAKTSETNANASRVAAEAARDQVQQIIDDAGEQSTLVTLAQVNGLQKIGRANTADILRAYEPTTPGESVLADINGLDYWYYDNTDTTTPDNGYFCIVTSVGKRWRRNNSKDYIDLNWLGLKPGLDVQPYWQAAIDIIHTAAMAQLSIYNLPYIRVQGGNYLLSGTITTPPYISTVFTKDTKLVADALVDGTHEAAIVIYCNDATNLYNNSRSSSFPKTISCSAGKVKLVRAGTRATTNPIGLYTKGATSTAHAINMRILDLEVSGAFLAGHGNTSTRTWLMRFDNCQFNGFYGIAYYGTNTDSGERITYSNCVASGGYNDPTTKSIYMETSGINLHFLSCSIDFTGGDIIYLTASAKWCTIEFEDSHIENWNGYLVNAEDTSNFARFIVFRATNMLPNGDLGYAQSLSRKLLKGGSCNVLFDDCFVSWTVYPYDSYDSIIETGSTITVRVRNHKNLNLGLHPFTTDNRLLRVYNFTTEAAGNVLTSSTATTTTTTVRKYGNSFANVTASIIALDNSLIDTSLASGTTNTLQLTWGSGGYAYIETVEKVRVTPSHDYGMKATVIMPDLTSKLNLSPAIAWYDENDNLISKTEVYYSDMNQIVNQSITGVAAYPSRANKRVACRTSSVKAPAGAAYARGVIQLTNGTTGSVYYLTDYNLFISPTN